jgi:phosphate transport system substrate-binding protein
MMNSKTGLVLGALSLLLCAIALQTPPQAAETLVIGGTGSATSVARKIAEAYRQTRPALVLQVLPSLGTSGGLRALADGQIDIALSARALKPQEREGMRLEPFARTPLAFVANADVTVSGLNTDALIAFFRGTATRWPDGTRARPVLRPYLDAESRVLAAWSKPLADALADAVYRTDLLVTMTTQENLETIEQIPGAFGYAPLSEVLTGDRPLRVLAFEGVEPLPALLAAGEYPLALTLAMVTNPATSEHARAFIDFVRSAAGARILEAAGCLPMVQ